MISSRILALTIAVAALLAGTAKNIAGVKKWQIATVTTKDATPLEHDCRRPMAAGYYDTAANKTFVCFTGDKMVPQVAAYDHTHDKWSTPVSVNMHPPTDDDHDYAHIFPLGDGRVGLTSSDHNRKLYFAKSENPGSIKGNWSVAEVRSNLRATYPMPMTSSDGTLYIMYRESGKLSDYRPINWVHSTDNGNSWSKPTPTIDFKNARADNLNEIYLGGMSYDSDHPHESLGEGYHGSWTIAGGGPGTHDHDDYHKNMYYAFFHMSNAHWYAADGTDLGGNIDNTEAEKYAKVFDSGELKGNKERGQTRDIGYTSKAVMDGDGKPVVAFQNGKTNSIDIGRWNGTEWIVTTPPIFKNSRALRDLANVQGKVLILKDHGNGCRVVKLHADGAWKNMAQYHPPLNANDNYFIDNANPEVFILPIKDTANGAVYSVAKCSH